MSSEYLDWTALASGSASLGEAAEDIFEGDSSVSGPSIGQASPQAEQRSLTELLAMESVPADLKRLVSRQQALEQQLDELTGHRAAPDWNEQRFSMPQHTAKSRLADKQKAQRHESYRTRVRGEVSQKALSRLRLDRGMQQAELARQVKLKQKKCQALQLQKRLSQLERNKRRVQNATAQARAKESERQRAQNDLRQQRLLKQALQRRQTVAKAALLESQKRQRLEQACLAERQALQRWQAQRDRQQQAQEQSLIEARAAQRQNDMLMAQQVRAEAKRQQRLALRAQERQVERLEVRRRLAQQEKKLFFS